VTVTLPSCLKSPFNAAFFVCGCFKLFIRNSWSAHYTQNSVKINAVPSEVRSQLRKSG
jgi:hypothetical protein